MHSVSRGHRPCACTERHLVREPGGPMVPPAADGRPCRESLRHTPMMNGHGKSDSSVVPQKSPNKVGHMAAAEEAEGRGLAKGNPQQQNASRTQSRSGARSALERVREVERNAPPRRHHLRQEPDAVIPLVRIRGGGRAQARSLLRLPAMDSLADEELGCTGTEWRAGTPALLPCGLTED